MQTLKIQFYLVTEKLLLIFCNFLLQTRMTSKGQRIVHKIAVFCIPINALMTYVIIGCYLSMEFYDLAINYVAVQFSYYLKCNNPNINLDANSKLILKPNHRIHYNRCHDLAS